MDTDPHRLRRELFRPGATAPPPPPDDGSGRAPELGDVLACSRNLSGYPRDDGSIQEGSSLLEQSADTRGMYGSVIIEVPEPDSAQTLLESLSMSVALSFQQSYKPAVMAPDNVSRRLAASDLQLGPARFFIVLACCYLNFTAFGFMAGLGVLYVPLLQQFNASSAETGLVQSLCNGVLFGGGLLGGGVVSALGPGVTSGLGSLVATVGCLVSVFAQNVPTLIATVGVVTGSGLSMMFVSSWASIGQLSSVLPSFAPTLMGMSAALGMFLAPFFNSAMLERFQWRGVYMMMAGLSLNGLPAGFFIYVILRRIRRHLGRARVSARMSWRDALHPELLTNWRYVLFGLVTIPFYATAMAPTLFMVDVASDLGLDIQTGSTCLAVMGGANVIGRTAPALIRRILKCKGLVQFAIFAPLSGIVAISFNMATNFPTLIAASVAFGLFFGVTAMALPQCVLDELASQDSYSAAIGYAYGISGIGDAISGPIGGAIKDITGNYRAVFWASAATGVLQGLIHLALRISCIPRGEQYQPLRS